MIFIATYKNSKEINATNHLSSLCLAEPADSLQHGVYILCVGRVPVQRRGHLRRWRPQVCAPAPGGGHDGVGQGGTVLKLFLEPRAGHNVSSVKLCLDLTNAPNTDKYKSCLLINFTFCRFFFTELFFKGLMARTKRVIHNNTCLSFIQELIIVLLEVIFAVLGIILFVLIILRVRVVTGQLYYIKGRVTYSQTVNY